MIDLATASPPCALGGSRRNPPAHDAGLDAFPVQPLQRDTVLRVEALGLDHVSSGIRHVVEPAVGHDAIHVHQQQFNFCSQLVHVSRQGQFSSKSLVYSRCSRLSISSYAGKFASSGLKVSPVRAGSSPRLLIVPSRSSAISTAPRLDASFSMHMVTGRPSASAIICVHARGCSSAPPD